ncbi:hypothetical protein T439DRAFT_232488 [Meredithblackwellia eburnea MCA 4105]
MYTPLPLSNPKEYPPILTSPEHGERHPPSSNVVVFWLAILQNLTVIAAVGLAFGVGATGIWSFNAATQDVPTLSSRYTTVVVVAGAVVGMIARGGVRNAARLMAERLTTSRSIGVDLFGWRWMTTSRWWSIYSSNTILGALPTALASFCGTAFITILAFQTTIMSFDKGYSFKYTPVRTSMAAQPLLTSDHKGHQFLSDNASQCGWSKFLYSNYESNGKPKFDFILTALNSNSDSAEICGASMVKVDVASSGAVWFGDLSLDEDHSAWEYPWWLNSSTFIGYDVCTWSLKETPLNCQLNILNPSSIETEVGDNGTPTKIKVDNVYVTMAGCVPGRSSFNISIIDGETTFYRLTSWGSQGFVTSKCQVRGDLENYWEGRTTRSTLSEDGTILQFRDQNTPCSPSYDKPSRQVLSQNFTGPSSEASTNSNPLGVDEAFMASLGMAFSWYSIGVQDGVQNDTGIFGPLPHVTIPGRLVVSLAAMGSFSLTAKTPWLIILLVPIMSLIITFTAGTSLVPRWDLSDPNANLAIFRDDPDDDKGAHGNENEQEQMYLRILLGKVRATRSRSGEFLEKEKQY